MHHEQPGSAPQRRLAPSQRQIPTPLFSDGLAGGLPSLRRLAACPARCLPALLAAPPLAPCPARSLPGSLPPCLPACPALPALPACLPCRPAAACPVFRRSGHPALP